MEVWSQGVKNLDTFSKELSIRINCHYYLTSSLVVQYTKSPIHFPQTAFVICYMLFAPLFGYLGDRYNRKSILMCGLALWSAATLVGRDGLVLAF